MSVHCQFKHIPSKRDGAQLADNIQTFVQPETFDKTGIRNCGENGNDSISFSLSRDKANSLRDKIDIVVPEVTSPIWFTILTDPLNDRPTHSVLNTEDVLHEGSTFKAPIQFGSLRSYNQFYSHVLLDNKYVTMSFKPAGIKPNSLYIEFDDKRIIIPLNSIQKRNILVNQKNKTGIYVLLPLKFPPCVYRLETVKQTSNTKQVRICANEANVEFIEDLAQCSDLVINFPPSQNMARMFVNHFLMHHPDHYHINFSTFKVSDWSKENLKKKIQRPDPFNYKKASFQDRYALQILTSLGFVFRDKWAQLTDQELNWNTWDPNERYSLCCFAAEQLRKDHGYDLTRTERDYRARQKDDKANSNKDEQGILVENKQRLKVATCTLTPLKVIFQPFEVTTGSRALRNPQFGGVERFLLVHFRDEDNQLLRTTSETIKKRLTESMRSGIDLFRKTFKYMGASTGQMKEKAFWFIDLPSNLNSMLDAHKVLGDFDDIKNIATYIARVGQYFSTTWPVNIRLVEVKNKSDIRPNSGQNYVFIDDDVEMNGYNFTDGIGKISWGLAGRVAQKMNIPLYRKEDIPSAFQVRVAGCKGMLAIDPASDFNDYYIHVRPSMIKFRSDDWNLEICEFARPITLTLNNQVIRLLSDLGNANGAFISLQNRGLTQWSVPEEQQPSAIDIGVQKNAAYSLSTDNLLTNRIPIPPEEGRNLFGVADESRELKYGQCFIQYSILNAPNNSERKFKVFTGTVIVTKNPCLWPGDFRKLTAVSNPKLEECMRDVIVFPIDGPRPHSNEIAGSDLDGDQYWVYWGDRLKIEKEVEPLSYKGAKKKDAPLINEETIIHHIVESFAAGVILGMIANTHTVVADRHKENSRGDDCRKLAELFALAVDSPKTGRFIDKKQIREFQSKYCRDGWPKFMRKYSEPTYESKSILEILFCKADEKYLELKEAPVISTFPQGIKPSKGPAVVKIKDRDFQQYLDGDTSNVVTPKAKPSAQPPKTTDASPQPKSKKTPVKPLEEDTIDSDTTETDSKPKAKRKPSAKPPKTTDDTPPLEVKKTGSDTTETASNPKAKKSTTPKDSHKLTNTGATASATSSLSSINIGQCQPDFLMAVDTKTMTSSNIQFIRATDDSYVINLAKGTTGDLDREKIIEKLTTYMAKLEVFKKKPNAYNDSDHGTLYLIIFYGYTYFVERDLPTKLGELQDMIKTKSGEPIRFNHADIDQLNTRSLSSSTTKKNKIVYEFDCYLKSSSSEYYSLLYDDKKKLRQIRVYWTWSKCYLRQPNFNVDSMYEIRSAITHESNSSQFDRIVESVFRTQATELLSGRSPEIIIDHDILSPELMPIRLKIIAGDHQPAMNCSDVDTFYRKVKYVSTDKQQAKPVVLSTLEYHASPISKNDDILERVCVDGLAPAKATS